MTSLHISNQQGKALLTPDVCLVAWATHLILMKDGKKVLVPMLSPGIGEGYLESVIKKSISESMGLGCASPIVNECSKRIGDKTGMLRYYGLEPKICW